MVIGEFIEQGGPPFSEEDGEFTFHEGEDKLSLTVQNCVEDMAGAGFGAHHFILVAG